MKGMGTDIRARAAVAALAGLVAVAAVMSGPLAAASAPKEIRIERVPETVEAFLALRNRLATSPEGGAAVFLVALLRYASDKAMGRTFLTIALDRGELSQGNDYKGFSPGASIAYHLGRFQPHWPRAYLKGAKAENGYKVAPPYVVTVSRNRYSGSEASGQVKVFLHLAGGRPRPVTMKVNSRGLWKASLVSSLFLPVPKPQKPDDL